MSRILPTRGTESERRAVAGEILVGEVHTTTDKLRHFLYNICTNPCWLGVVADESTMTSLDTDHARGCQSGDFCYRSDTQSLMVCVSNHGEDPGDWEVMIGFDVNAEAFDIRNDWLMGT